jgi:hypothetical protein
MSIASTRDAIDSTNGGTFTTAGGMAVGKAMFVGGNIVSTGNLVSNSAAEASGLSTGSLYTLGGSSVSKNLYVGGSTNLLSTLSVSGTAAFTDASDPAVSLSGGIAVAKSCTVSGQLTASSAATVAGILTSTNTTDSTGTTNGAVVISGGLGLGATFRTAGSIYSGGNLTLTGSASTATFPGVVSLTNTSDTASLGTGAFVVSSGISVAQSAFFGKNVTVSGATTFLGTTAFSSDISSAGNVAIAASTPSTDPSTGALVVTGGFGISGTTNSSGIVILSNTTDASSSASGTLVLSNGGLGVSRSAYIGTTLHVAGASTLVGTLTASDITTDGTLTNTASTASSSPTTGAAVFAGGVGIGGSLNVGANISIAGTGSFVGNQTFSGILNSNNATEATSLTVASVVLSGGLSATKSIQVGLNATVGANATVGGVLTCLDTTPSTSPTTGATVVSGGLGVGGSANFGGTLSTAGGSTFGSTIHVVGVASLDNTTDATSTTTGSLVTAGGIATARSAYVGTNLTALGSTVLGGSVTANGIVSVANTTDSTAHTNGSVVLSGGLGIAMSINCNRNLSVAGTSSFVGTCTFADATDSNASNAGSVIFSGGVGIGKNLNVGGGFSVSAASTFAGGISNPAGSLALNAVSMVDSSGMLYVRTPTPSLRIAATDAAKTVRYANTLELFTLGNTYLDANYESLQLTSTGNNSYSLLSRAAGSGVVRSIVVSTAGNSNQMVLNIDGTVSVGSSTVDSTSIVTGSVRTSGGLGVPGSISVGKNWRMFGATSGSVTFATPATVASYTLTLPSTVSPAANYALVSDTTGALGWAQMTTPNPSFQSVSITNTTASDATTTGALTVAGGIGIGGAEYLGGNLTLTGGAGANMIVSNGNGHSAPTYNSRSPGTRFVLDPTISSTSGDYAIGVMGGYQWFSTDVAEHGFKWYAGVNSILTLDATGMQLYPGASLTYSGATSGTVKISPPATATSYALTLPSALPSASNYALVSDTTGNLSWSQMITPNPIFNTVSVSATTPSTGIGTGAFVVTGGASVGSNLAVRSNLMMVAPTSGTVTIATPDNNASPIFTLPGSLPSQPGQLLQSDGVGKLSWANAPTSSTFTTSLGNNVTTPTAISGLRFSDMFRIDIYVKTTTTTATNGAMHTLRGFQSSSGWTLYEDFAGDPTGVDFSISTDGQIAYTSGNVANWTNGTATWTAPQIYSTPPGGTPQQASGANNQTAPTNVNGLVMSPPQFSSYVLVTVNNSTVANSTVSLYQIQGTYQQNGTWVFSSQIVSGPDPGIRFSITTDGQIQYTSPDTVGWLSTTFQFYGGAIALQNSASYANMVVTDTTDASSASTGALRVAGGANVGKSLLLQGSRQNMWYNTDANAGWYVLGNFTSANIGGRLKLSLLGASGYDRTINYGGETIIYVTVNNNISSTVANVNGSFYSIGDVSMITSVKFVEVNRMSYDVVAYFNNYSSHAVIANSTAGCTFTSSLTPTADPGANSTTVQTAQFNTLVIQTPSPPVYTNAVWGQFNIPSASYSGTDQWITLSNGSGSMNVTTSDIVIPYTGLYSISLGFDVNNAAVTEVILFANDNTNRIITGCWGNNPAPDTRFSFAATAALNLNDAIHLSVSFSTATTITNTFSKGLVISLIARTA